MAQIGDRIGPFELVERVRRGRCTTVFRGTRRDTLQRHPREVAIRVADGGEEGPAPALMDALRAEYDTLRLLSDERIPGASALYTGHGAVALQWVRGVPLREALRLVEAGRIDLDATTSVDILVELAYALRHAHAIVRDEGRIVHGTLSADVVWLTQEGGIVLHGFADPDPVHVWPVAPEQQQDVQDARTDQWQLGALGIELLRHAPEVLAEAKGAPIDVAFALLQQRWPAATRLLGRMLAEDPAHRYESEERLIKDLLALARGLGGVSRRAEVGARAMQLLEAGVEAPPRRPVERSPVELPPTPAIRPARPATDAPLEAEPPPATWPRFDAPAAPTPAIAPAVRSLPPGPTPKRASVPLQQPLPAIRPAARPAASVPAAAGPSAARPAVSVPAAHPGDHEVTVVETRDLLADAEETLVRAGVPDQEFDLGVEPVVVEDTSDPDSALSDIATLEVEEPAVDAPTPRIAPVAAAAPAAIAMGPSLAIGAPSISIGAPSMGPPSIAIGPPPSVAPAEVSVEVEDTGEAAFFAAGTRDGEPALAATAPAEPDAPVADVPVAPRPRPAPPADDPVPDQWVVGSIAVFAVVAVLAVAWTLA